MFHSVSPRKSQGPVPSLTFDWKFSQLPDTVIPRVARRRQSLSALAERVATKIRERMPIDRKGLSQNPTDAPIEPAHDQPCTLPQLRFTPGLEVPAEFTQTRQRSILRHTGKGGTWQLGSIFAGDDVQQVTFVPESKTASGEASTDGRLRPFFEKSALYTASLPRLAAAPRLAADEGLPASPVTPDPPTLHAAELIRLLVPPPQYNDVAGCEKASDEVATASISDSRRDSSSFRISLGEQSKQ